MTAARAWDRQDYAIVALFLFFVTANVIDLASTLAGLAGGNFQEGNRVVALVIARLGISALVLLKAAGVAVIGASVYEIGFRFPKARSATEDTDVVVLLLLNAVFWLVAAHNVSLLGWL